MDSRQPIKLFISHARAGGAELARGRGQGLNDPGFGAWLDISQLGGA
jgi:hypothetical protein